MKKKVTRAKVTMEFLVIIDSTSDIEWHASEDHLDVIEFVTTEVIASEEN